MTFSALASRRGLFSSFGRAIRREDGGVPAPDAAFSYVPFSIIDDGDGTFSIGSFNLQTHAGIAVSKTYYVSTTGVDTNDGLSWETALRKPATALAKSDVDRVYIGAGVYGFGQSPLGLSLNRSVEIIGVGDVYLTYDLRTTYVGAFSKVDNHYVASYTTNAGCKAVDLSNTDSYGDPLMYTLKASEAEVEAAAGSFYYDTTGDKVYIRTIDDRAVDSDILLIYGGLFINKKIANRTVYLENLKFIIGGVAIFDGDTGGSKFYAKDCTFDCLFFDVAFSMTNLADAIYQNCAITRSIDDGIKQNLGNMIQIDCEIYHCGDDVACNSSSCHGGYAVIINGEYHHVYGRPIHDIGNGKGWYLGAYAHDAGVGVYANFTAGDLGGYGFETWCDQCRSANSDYDFMGGDTSGKIHKHNCTGDATDMGTVDTYTY